MVDLETLGTKPNAHILSIGACDINNPDITYYSTIEGNSQNRVTEFSTIRWWCNQSSEAIKAATNRKHMRPLPQMLMEFITWWHAHGFTHPYSHGSVFDIIILENAMRQYNYEIPWKFWQIRDTRTLYDTAYRITGKTLKPIREGIHHDALADAQFQAQWIRDIRAVIEP